MPRLSHSPLNQTANEGKITAFLAAAASLLRDFEKRKHIVSREYRDELKPIYCIDNDILNLYLNPSKVGPKGSRPNDAGYGVVFPDDSEEDATKTAAVLADFLVDNLSQYPLLQLTPVAEEALDILAAIERKSRRQDWTKSLAEQKEVAINDLVDDSTFRSGEGAGEIAALAELLSASIKKPNFEKAAEKTLQTFFITVSARLELVRFLSLLASGKVQSTHYATTFGDSFPKEVVKALSGPQSMSDLYEVFDKTRYWASLLANHKSKINLNKRTERDARALALLEFVNDRIKHKGFILYFITGDKSLEQGLRLDNANRVGDWIINPRAFLVEALERRAEKPSAETQRPFELSLIALMSEAEGSQGYKTRIGDKSIGDLYREAMGHWTKLKGNLPPARLFDQGSYQREIAEIVGKLPMMQESAVAAKLTEIHTSYESKTSELWDKFENSASSAAVVMGMANAASHKSRNPPTVIFRSFPNTRQLVLKLVAMKPEGLESPQLVKELSDPGKGDVNFPVEKKYLRYLVFAMVAGANGDWRLARVLSERAVAVSTGTKQENPTSNVDGREAMFVLAQAERLLATNADGLTRALRHLDACQMLGAESASSPPDDYDRIKAIRCSAEQISFAVTHAHLSVWTEGQDLQIAELQMIADQIEHLRDELLNLASNHQEVRDIKSILLSYLFVNVMQVEHLAAVSESGSNARFLELAKVLYADYRKAIESAAAHETYLMKFYSTYFIVLNGSVLHRPDKQWLSVSSTSDSIRKHTITVYDKRRFEDLSQRILA